MPAFSAPDLSFSCPSRTLMAQRLDLERLHPTGEPIRVAEGVDTLGPGAASRSPRAARSCTGQAAGTSLSSRGFSAMALRPGRWDNRRAYVNLALSSDGRQAAIDRFDLTPGIWLLDVTRGTATRATFGGQYQSTPVWRPTVPLRVRGSAGHAAEPLPEANWNGGRRRAAVPHDASELSTELVRRRPLHRVRDRGPQDGRRYLGAADGRDRSRSRFSRRRSLNITLESRPMADGWRTRRTSRAEGTSTSRAFPNPSGNGRSPPMAEGSRCGAGTGASCSTAAPMGPSWRFRLRQAPSFAPGTPIPLFKPQAAIGALGLGRLRRRA